MLLSSIAFSQINDNIVYQGLIYGKTLKNTIGTIYIEKKSDQLTVRQEFLNDEKDYVLTKASIKSGNTTILNQSGLISKNIGLKNQFCPYVISLKEQDSLGYIYGEISSSQCRNSKYDLVLFESTLALNQSNSNNYNNYWIKEAQKRFDKNYPAPSLLAKKRANFKLFTVYFDYDKFDIRQEYIDKLNEMSMIVDSHSDFRILITGHTDSDGSDNYNDELSKNRAYQIKEYLISQGVNENKILIEFKGEKLPASNNNSPEGKQRNRRVEIQFI